MLSADNFAFGEMLNSAAQWPSVGGTGYVDVGKDQYMAGLGVDLETYLYS